MKVLCVYRDECYSPNSVAKDKAILDAVGETLSRMGHVVNYVAEARLQSVEADVCLSMARSMAALAILRQSGVRCVNTPDGVALCCHRHALDAMMRRESVMMPPLTAADGWWLKRGDGAAQQKEDVVFCKDDESLLVARQQMTARGITEQVVSAHVEGDLVKFYGVRGGDFFRCYYPSDDGISKFGDEARNGLARHYPFDIALLHREAERLAVLTGVDVYGGDCVVDSYGRLYIIDFNDWPSFSRCRDEAARAIVEMLRGER